MAEEFNIRAEIEYDGTLFKGWQVQPGLRTVQGELEAALQKIHGQPVILHGAGRTDTGVHAICQVANFRSRKSLDLGRLMQSLNSMTGDDVRVLTLCHVPDEFHARFSALSRTYHYVIGTDDRSLSPFCRRYAWHIGHELNTTLLQEPIASLIGEKDFSNLSKNDPSRDNFTAAVHHASLRECDLGLMFEIAANRFLPQMVRRIVGTLVAISRGEAPPETIRRLLEETGAASSRIHLAPPGGLFLAWIDYDGIRGNRDRESVLWNRRYLNEIFH